MVPPIPPESTSQQVKKGPPPFSSVMGQATAALAAVTSQGVCVHLCVSIFMEGMQACMCGSKQCSWSLCATN